MTATAPALARSAEEREIIERLSTESVPDLASLQQVVAALASADARGPRQTLDLRDRAAVEQNLARLRIGPPPEGLAPAVLDLWRQFENEWANEANWTRVQERFAALEVTLGERERAREKTELELQSNRDRVEALKRLADVLDLLAGLSLTTPPESIP
jgi:5'-deoxynucleotidase YfbR-like HD superfamily hydrolase